MSARCTNCGALAREVGQVDCAYCGSALPREAPVPAPEAATLQRAPSVADLLALVEQHAQLSAWMAHTPSAARVQAGLGVALGCGIAFTLLAFVLMVLTASGGAGFALLLLLLLAAGLFVAIRAGIKAARFSSAPLLRVPALVVDKRTEIPGGGGRSSASTSCFATLETTDGARSEQAVDARLSATIAPGDYGLAFVRGGILLDFRRVGSR